MTQGSLPIIDWELATKLAGGNPTLAKDLLTMLVAQLTEDHIFLLQCLTEQNYAELLKRVHKLHGALCYCGLPRLKRIVAQLETELKNNIMISLPYLFDQLDKEIKLLLEHYAHHLV